MWQPLKDATGRTIAHEPVIVRRIEKHAGERDRDEDGTQPVDDECRCRVMVREDVLTDQRRGKRDDPDGDQQQQVQVQKAPIDALAMLEQRVVIDPDDADREEADKVGDEHRPVLAELLQEVAKCTVPSFSPAVACGCSCAMLLPTVRIRIQALKIRIRNMAIPP